MRVDDVMTKPVKSVASTMAAEDALNVMRVQGVHHLVVLQDGELVGLLSERDAGGRRGASMRKNRTVADLMTQPVITVDAGTTIRRAANLMRGRSIGCLVVVRNGKVAGIVSVSDLLTLLGSGAERPVASTRRWTLKHRTPHRKEHGAVTAW